MLGSMPLWFGLALPGTALAADTIFDGTDSAGSAQITTNGGDAVIFNDQSTAAQAGIINNSGGSTRFNDDSDAGTSQITNNSGGSLSFSDESSAAGATIVNNGGGTLAFSGTASAGAAIVTNNGNAIFSGAATAGAGAKIVTNASGVLTFADNASAGTSILTVNGKLEFENSSSAGGAQIINNETGIVDFLNASSLVDAQVNNSGAFNLSGTSGAGAAVITNNEKGAIVLSGNSSLEQATLFNNGTVVFRGHATAGTTEFVVNNAGGSIQFQEASSAGSARIVNDDTVAFSGASSAGSADLINNGTGAIRFSGTSTAADSTINNGGTLAFSGQSTAGAATITTGPGGLTTFADGASGGTASLQIDKDPDSGVAGTVDISQVTTGSIGVGSLDGAGTVRLGGNALEVGGNNLATTFAGALTDGGIAGGTGGSLVKVGDGQLTLGGSNSYTGRTEVRSGTLQAGANDAFASRSAFTVADGATLDLAGFTATIGSLAGAGAVTLNNVASELRIGGDNTSTVFSGMISGEGDLVKFGSGTLALTATNSYQGTTTVTGGTLQVDGDITASSSVVVGVGGTLSGTGTVGPATIAGILMGGNGVAPGTLKVQGNLVLEESSTLRTVVDGSGMSAIEVDGNVQLDGGSLRLAVSAVPLQVGTSYTILASTGEITGTFGSTFSDYAFLDPTIDYNLDSVAVTLDRNDTSFASVGETPNQKATGGAIEQLAAGNPVYDAVLPLEVGTARAAFDNLSGEIHATALGTLQAQSEQTRAALLGRMRNSGWVEGYTPWMTGYGARTNFEGDGNAAGGSQSSAGVLAGIDRTSENVRVGVAFGGGQGELTVDDRGSKAELQSVILAGYGQWSHDQWRMRGGAAMALHELDVERRIDVAPLGGTARSQYDGWTAQAFGELGYVVRFGASEVEPMAGLACGRTELDGFTETGAGAANLSSDGSSLSGCVTTLGLRASHRFDLANGLWIRPRVAAAWSHQLSSGQPVVDMAFSGGGAFQIAGIGAAQDAATLDAGLDLGMVHGATGFLNYAGRFAAGEDSHAVQLGVHISY